MKTNRHSNLWLAALAATALISTVQAGAPASGKTPVTAPPEAVDWKTNTIAPVANPIFFEDAIIRSEIRPIFAYHNIDNGFITGGGDAQLYAVQLRFAITDRLAFIATQDGFFDINLDSGAKLDGWMDLAAGFKYALIDDKANQFILTPGFTFHIPSGSEEVFQGRGDGEWNLFVSAQKGFGDFHLQSNVGVRLPHDGDAQSTILHYGLMADYYVAKLFIPFVAVNAWTVLADGNGLPIDSEGYDVINFGASQASGTTQATAAVGFRSRLTNSIDFGIAYEKAILSPEGLTDDRITADFCIRF